MRPTLSERAHLTLDALDHCLPPALRVVRPPASAEHPAEVTPVHIFVVRTLLVRMQRARVREPARGAVTPEGALWKQFQLLVVGVARDRARGTYTPRGGGRGGRRGAGEAEVDGLADVPEGVGAMRTI